MATAVLDRLVDNAVRHGVTPGSADQSLAVRLRVAESERLLLDVEDPSPLFRDFEAALRGEQGRGLWETRRFGAEVAWFLRTGAVGKTVRAALLAKVGQP
ncbi:hypothetical protein V1460_25035 [Streptomyces sp. SCSIO 30461]|uniref:hypothetical protein n=1 Tax=Streptomyces sp. SCSIO 30461 TaxID=3118085 RepID=UPI0030CEED6F